MPSYSESFTPALRGGASWRSWRGYNSFTIAPTYPGDTVISARVADPSDGVAWSPEQAREVAADLLARADLIDAQCGAR